MLFTKTKKRFISAVLTMAMVVGAGVTIPIMVEASGVPYRCGDIDGNGRIDIFDSSEILEYLVGLPNAIDRDARSRRAALICRDVGEVSITDYTDILEYIQGISGNKLSRCNCNPNNYPSTVTITFNPQKGNVSQRKRTIRTGYRIDSVGALPTPTRTSHIFNGWYTAASGGSAVSGSTTFSNNATIYARWTSNYIWNSDYNSVAFWNVGTIKVFANTLGSVSSGFNFTTRVTEARNQWSNALGRDISSTNESSANIRAYGGERARMQAESGNNGIWSGLTNFYQESTATATISANGSKTVYKAYETTSSQYITKIYVVQISTNASWTTDEINRTKLTTTHELGHALGYNGHSANSLDVMHKDNKPQFTLRASEILHLKQIYDNFRS